MHRPMPYRKVYAAEENCYAGWSRPQQKIAALVPEQTVFVSFSAASPSTQ
jgi:hypothetical protein